MIRFYLFAFALLGSLAVAAVAGEPKLPKNIVRSFDKSSEPSQKLKYQAPDYLFNQVVRVSPDGKYVARLGTTDAEVGILTVYRRAGKKNVFTKSYKVSQEFGNVNSGIWVPKVGHHLVVTMGGADYGSGGIALWTNSHKTRFLRRAKSEVAEGFSAWGVSSDGRILYYEHFGLNSPDPKYKRDTVQTMRLTK